MVTLIKGGYVVNPATGLEGVNDVLIVDETVAEIAPQIEREAHCVIDAAGKYVMPGFVDLHEHLREPGFEYKEQLQPGRWRLRQVDLQQSVQCQTQIQ